MVVMGLVLETAEMQAGNTKICAKCRVEKPVENFFVKRSEKGGRDYNCKPCYKVMRQKRRLARIVHFKKKERAQRKKWRLENPQRCSELKKASKIRTSYRRFKKNQCESCGFVAIDPCQLDVDHIDGINTNDDPNNLQTLCANCHRLKTKLNRDDRSYLRLVDV